jgi:uncharacterized membrane protein YfcA
MEFVTLTLIAEVGATLAGFATLTSALNKTRDNSTAMWGVVLLSLSAMIFSFLGLRFAGSADMIRVLAALLFVISFLQMMHAWREGVRAARDNMRRAQEKSIRSDEDIPSLVFGCSAALCSTLPPSMAILVATNAFPESAKLIYELALQSLLLEAALLMLYLTWRTLAARMAPLDT